MELYQNTLLKLVVRQGTDLTRKSVVLTSGELGYTNDTERLFVGNGSLSGGVVVGNKNLGSAPDITTLAPGVIGDFAFDNDRKRLYRLQYNDGSLSTDWELIAIAPTHVYAKYSGSLSALEFSNITTTIGTRLSAGHYRITFDALPSINYVPIAQIYGETPYGYSARVSVATVSSCDIMVLSSTGAKTDATVTLSINY